MPADPFTAFLASWAASKMLDLGIDVFSRAAGDQLLRSLGDSPQSHQWPDELTSDQINLLRTVRNTKPSRIKSFVARLRTAKDRSIVLVAPSGVGKTCVAMRLAGQTPERVVATRNTPEVTRFVAALRAINVYAPPGHYLHGDYLDTISGLMTSHKPPSVIVMVTCGGYHATADPQYEGTIQEPNFDRPGRTGKRVAELKAFLDENLKEEVGYIRDLCARLKGKMRESIPWVITVVNKKDLWWKARVKTMNRYTSETSHYGVELLNLRGPRCIGAPDASTAQHVVFPAYIIDDGFGPSPSITSTCFRQAHMEADAMVLRSLVFNKYARGH